MGTTITNTIQELNGAGVNELADHLGYPASTTQVHLNTLRESGYVVRDGTDYRLGLKFLNHGGYARRQLSLYHAAKAHIDELAAETGEAANLGIEENGKRVLVYKSESPIDAVYDNAPTGERTLLHWTALGKALLSQMSTDTVDSIVDQHGLPRANEHTIVNRETLSEELRETRARGYSIEDQDRRKGILAVGVPIVNETTSEVAGTDLVNDTIRTLREEGYTQVVVSHSFEAVLELADRIAVLYQGRIADVVRPSEVDKQVMTDLITTGHR